MPILPEELLINVISHAGIGGLKGYNRTIAVWPTLENIYPLLNILKVWLDSDEIGNANIANKLSFVRNMSVNCSQIINLDASALSNLTNLTSLDLSGCPSLLDVSALHSLTTLTTLRLSMCPSLLDISALRYLTNLTSLNLSMCTSRSDVSALHSLTNLTSLDLYGCRSLSDISALSNLTNLTRLVLSYTAVSQPDIDQIRLDLPDTDIRH